MCMPFAIDFSFLLQLAIDDHGIGLVIYDSMQSNFSASLMDALVIGTQYENSQRLLDALTPGVNPFIMDPR